MQASNAPSKSAVPFAESGTKNAIPVASQIGVTPGAASFTDGFPPLTMTPLAAGGVPPHGADFNGIFNFLSAAVRWAQAGAPYKFDSAFSSSIGGFPQGATLQSSDGAGRWRSLIDNNSTNPDTGGSGWITETNAGLAGSFSNMRCSLPVSAATATFTADEVVVAAALGGHTYRLGSFNKTLNIATIGPSGMDTGTAPISGWVGIYAAYNPLTGASTIFATNATVSAPGTIYSGSNLPAGYTATALISTWRITGTGLLYGGFQSDRTVNYLGLLVLSVSTTQTTLTAFSISGAVPPNAKSAFGSINATAAGASIIGASIAASSAPYGNQSGQVAAGSVQQVLNQFNTLMITSQTLYYSFSSTGGSSPAMTVSVVGYTF